MNTSMFRLFANNKDHATTVFRPGKRSRVVIQRLRRRVTPRRTRP
jgi:hypothetical protein